MNTLSPPPADVAIDAIYKHTQVGYVSIVAAVVVLIFFGWWVRRHKGDDDDDVSSNRTSSLSARVVVALTLLIAMLFVTLTIRVDPVRVSWSFGPGLIRGSVEVAEITAVRPITTSATGWGMRQTPSGWLYNVSGHDAIQLDLQNGRQIDLGTDDTSALLSALDVALKARHVK